ncbi:anti-sigma factor family protein [Streptomyces sp. NPDC048567]|uniref:anti-sigma factor family protein n=1 Tax=Streptomyces sp. NPDC048567 TaxID=3365570 RepID=UPI003713DD7E
MTSTPGTTQHPEVSEISDLTEDLLPGVRAAEIRSHLDDCDLCADVLASLEEIRALLGDLPAPEPMPTDIADRIDVALAAEARTHRAESDSATDVSRETEPLQEPGHIAGNPPSRSHAPDRPAGHAHANTGPGRRPGRRRRRTTLLASAFGAAALVGMSVFLLQNVPGAGRSDTSAAGVSQDTTATAPKSRSQEFSAATLEDQVHALLGRTSGTKSPQTPKGNDEAPSIGSQSSPHSQPPLQADPSDSLSPESPLRAPAVPVPACVEEGIGRNSPALAVERGSYEGTDAFLVLLPHPTDPDSVQAYVVDAACVGAQPPAKGKLLLTHAYARR